MTEPRPRSADEAGSDISIVGIAGAGAMGAGFAQVALEAGREVVLYDVDPGAVERAVERVRDGLVRRARTTEPSTSGTERSGLIEARLAGLRRATTLVELATEADLVIEAVLEDLELKRTIFHALDAEADPAVILATNTSALSVAAIAAATTRPERVLGLHGFNPVPLMPLIEVVPTAATAPRILERAVAEIMAWGKFPVRSTDTPGFIVNRVNRPFTIEALRLLEAGEATVSAIDEALRTAGYPLGPFELMDLSGLDVNLAAATAVWEGLGRPDRLRPSPIQTGLVEAGQLGRKTGRGFYHYDDRGRPGEIAAPFDRPAKTTALSAPEIVERIEARVSAEAEMAVRDGVAAADQIDLALRLGAGHPHGQFGRHRRP